MPSGVGLSPAWMTVRQTRSTAPSTGSTRPEEHVVHEQDATPHSSSESAISAGLQRKLTGTTTPPAHGIASSASWKMSELSDRIADPIAVLEAERREGTGEARDPLARLGDGPLAVAEHRVGAVGRRAASLGAAAV